jgi:O-antigen ligase
LTLSGRTTLWSSLIADLSPQNIWGYGVGGARHYLRTVNPWFSHSHNSALETIYMSGYLGLLATVGAVGISLFNCLARWDILNARVFACTASYILAVGMMNPSWYDASSLIMFSMLCSVPWARLCSKERQAVRGGLRYASSFTN